MKAFPINHQEDANGNVLAYAEFGMDLRDYFAAKAIQGLVVGKDVINRDATAKVAYELADSMMKARG